MRRGVCIMLGWGAGLALGAVAAQAGEIRWMSSFAEAKNAAKERDALIMIDFWAPW